MTLETIAAGGKAALARALAVLESNPDAGPTADLLSAAHQAPRGHVVGITGPPGVGKSTLLNTLIAAWRGEGKTVGIIAVDPSSRRSGGALLGDRTRLKNDPEDQGVFVRSMAARDHLGGLAGLTTAAMVLMRALYDVVIVESVGVGQSETEIAGVADTVVFCVQPGSGDSLQYMKAGIAEIPHIVAVTKADMAVAAERARADVAGALTLSEHWSDWDVPVLKLSASRGQGVDALIAAIANHATHLNTDGRLSRARHTQAETWLEAFVRERFGREGLRRAGRLSLNDGESPFARLAEIAKTLGADA
ncbi:methylmalonyl Co-A mutase-associated GTPase MeaB [uncultured Rhodospira sp.]|uniref:methylmalonyl Co-A mutase-associated GTPase MeaB n=1 Tax=uncultured Rhodospira sp. TaxID=1936189 RepID=UPI002622CB6B|nr:methylmalonyl Co-A mutase-associated GTPase MeaB [uncultured Rhodospira sp.]